MADDQADSQERSEEPTDQRRKSFREKGQIPVSRDLISVTSMLVVIPLIVVGAPQAIEAVCSSIRTPLELLATPAESMDTWRLWIPQLVTTCIVAIAPMLLAICLVAMVVGLAQTQGNVSFKAIKPDFSKLNPLDGIKRLVGSHAWIELLKSLLKLGAVLIAAYLVMKADMDSLLTLCRADLHRSLGVMAETALRLCGATAVALLAPAVLDYGIQIYKNTKKMRMTREELKRDLKDQEGDPHVKARRRRMAQEMSANRMIGSVPDADVIVNNPEHIAVALRYIHGVTEVPEIVAMGADHLALRIRTEARQHGIPQLQNRPLARTLYRTCAVGDPIPAEMFGAVAEILSFVHRIRGLRGMEPAQPAPSSE